MDASLRSTLLHEHEYAQLAKLTRLRSVLSASLPAIINNAAAPVAAALQLGLLGHSTNAANRVAVWSAIGAATTFVTNVANFLIVVTMARVGHALGAKKWELLGSTVRAVLMVAVLVGCVCGLALWLGREPLLTSLSLDAAPMHAISSSYLPLALARLPPLLVLKAASAVLVGYQRVRTASMLNLALACADTIGFYVVLHALDGSLVALGATLASTCTVAALIAVLAVLCLPPNPTVRILCCCGDANDADGGGAEGNGSSSGGVSLGSLACDSLNVLIRSTFLSGSILALMLSIAPLGAAAIGAHAVVLQLWMVTSSEIDRPC